MINYIFRKRFLFFLLFFSLLSSNAFASLKLFTQGASKTGNPESFIVGIGEMIKHARTITPNSKNSFKTQLIIALDNAQRIIPTIPVEEREKFLDVAWNLMGEVSAGWSPKAYSKDEVIEILRPYRDWYVGEIRILRELLAPAPPEPVIIREPYPVPAPQPAAAEPPRVIEREVERRVEVVPPAMQDELERLRAEVQELQRNLAEARATTEEKARLAEAAAEAEEKARGEAAREAERLKSVAEEAQTQLRTKFEQSQQEKEKILQELEAARKAEEQVRAEALEEAQQAKTILEDQLKELRKAREVAEIEKLKAVELEKEQAKLQKQFEAAQQARVVQEAEASKIQKELQQQLEKLETEKRKREAEDLKILSESQIVRQRGQKFVDDAQERLNVTREELDRVKSKIPSNLKVDNFSELRSKVQDEIINKEIDEIRYSTEDLADIRSLLSRRIDLQQRLFELNIATITQKIESLRLPTTTPDQAIILEEEISNLEKDNEDILNKQNAIRDLLRNLDEKMYEMKIRIEREKDELEKANQELMSQSSLFISTKQEKEQAISDLEQAISDLEKKSKDLEIEKQRLETTVQQATAESKRLRSEAEVARAQLQAELQQVRAQAAEVKSEAAREKEELQTQLEQARVAEEKAKSEEVEAKGLAEARAAEVVEKTRVAAEEQAKLQQQLEESQQAKTTLEDQLEELIKSKEVLETDRVQLQADLKQTKESLNEQLEQIQQEKEKISKELEASKESAERARAEAEIKLEAEKKAREAEEQAKKAAIEGRAKLETQLEAVKEAKAVAEKTATESLEAAADKVRISAEEKAEAVAAREALKEQLEQVQQEKEVQVKELEAERERVVEAVQQAAEARKAIAETEEKVRTVEEEKQKLEEAVRKAQEEKERAAREAAEARIELQNQLEAEKTELQQQLEQSKEAAEKAAAEAKRLAEEKQIEAISDLNMEGQKRLNAAQNVWDEARKKLEARAIAAVDAANRAMNVLRLENEKLRRLLAESIPPAELQARLAATEAERERLLQQVEKERKSRIETGIRLSIALSEIIQNKSTGWNEITAILLGGKSTSVKKSVEIEGIEINVAPKKPRLDNKIDLISRIVNAGFTPVARVKEGQDLAAETFFGKNFLNPFLKSVLEVLQQYNHNMENMLKYTRRFNELTEKRSKNLAEGQEFRSLPNQIRHLKSELKKIEDESGKIISWAPELIKIMEKGRVVTGLTKDGETKYETKPWNVFLTKPMRDGMLVSARNAVELTQDYINTGL